MTKAIILIIIITGVIPFGISILYMFFGFERYNEWVTKSLPLVWYVTSLTILLVFIDELRPVINNFCNS